MAEEHRESIIIFVSTVIDVFLQRHNLRANLFGRKAVLGLAEKKSLLETCPYLPRFVARGLFAITSYVFLVRDLTD